MYLKNNLFIVVIILFFISAVLSACGNNEMELLNSKNSDLKEELIKREREIASYKEQISRLKEESKQQAEDVSIRYLNEVVEFKKETVSLQNEIEILNDEVLGLKTEIYFGNRKIELLNTYISTIHEQREKIQNVIEPQYLLNVFDPIEVTKGDVIAELTVEGKKIGSFENINVCLYEDIEFNGKYKLKGKVYRNKDSNKVEIVIDKSQFINIPLHINYIEMESMNITVLNGHELINCLEDEYYDGIEILALFSGLIYHSKVEAEKMIDTTFVKLIS